MKPHSLLAAIVTALLFCGCEPPDEAPPESDAGTDLPSNNGTDTGDDVGEDDAGDDVDDDVGEPEPLDIAPCEQGLPDDVIAALGTALVTEYDSGSPSALGLVVGVAAPGEGMRLQAIGFQDPEKQIPMREDAVFDIGSIQKNFRWMLMWRLAEMGQVDLNRPVDDFVDRPELGTATMAQLSNHTTGLLHWDQTPAFLGAAFSQPTETLDYEAMMDFLEDAGTTWSEPGSFRYSNYGPLIAGEALENIMGAPAQDLTTTHVLEPLSLDSTTFQTTQTRPDKLVDGYWANEQPHDWTDEYGDAKALSSAAGGLMYSDGCDLLKYSQAIANNPDFIAPETLAVLQGTEVDWTTSEGLLFGQHGLGLQRITIIPDLAGMYGHLGDGQHGHSTIFMFRDDGTSFVVMANVAAVTTSTPGEVGDGYLTHLVALAVLNGFYPEN